MAAFRSAVGHQVSWVEADVDVIADGTVIICHDSTLDRTTNRTGRYDDLTITDLAGIDAGGWFSSQYEGEPLPTLGNLIDLMNEAGLNASIEIKPNETGKEGTLRLIDGVVAQLERLRPGPKVIVSSFSHVLLHLLKQRAPHVPVGCLYESRTLGDDWRSTLEIVGADYIHPEDTGLTRQQVQAFEPRATASTSGPSTRSAGPTSSSTGESPESSPTSPTRFLAADTSCPQHIFLRSSLKGRTWSHDCVHIRVVP